MDMADTRFILETYYVPLNVSLMGNGEDEDCYNCIIEAIRWQTRHYLTDYRKLEFCGKD